MATPSEDSAVLGFEVAKLLATLCQQGKLYEVEKWIASGKSLAGPPECKTTPLQIALDRGFHSLVELLARNDCGQEAKNHSWMNAVSKRNLEFIELLVNRGADLPSVPFSHVLLSWDPTISRFSPNVERTSSTARRLPRHSLPRSGLRFALSWNAKERRYGAEAIRPPARCANFIVRIQVWPF
jgi:hypothetical protein